MATIIEMRVAYCQANRCWQVNNLKSCVRICSSLTRDLGEFTPANEGETLASAQLHHLVWFLKTKCLAEDYYLNESFLLNEEDIESDDRVRTINASSSTARGTNVRPITAQPANSRAMAGSASRRKITDSSRIDTRSQMRTAMLTGKTPLRTSSRQSGPTTTSYRPLTTSLTATQTAFSRSTRPLLKYSTCRFLSKPIYEYLYNAQSMTNVCPDYRQCLEYLNLVRTSRKPRMTSKATMQAQQTAGDQLIRLSSNDSDSTDSKQLGVFWTIAVGTCYYHLKMHKQAEEFFQICLGIDSKYLDAYLWLIKVYIRTNQPIRVLKTCDQGTANSRNAILYNWKARVQSLMSQPLGAHLCLRESLQFFPTNIEALANVGHYSFYEDKFELALKCFERVNQLSMDYGVGDGASLDMNPRSPNSSAELYNNLALCYFQCGYYERVLPLFQMAFLHSPNKETTSNIWYNISFLPQAFGARSLAIACLRLALKNESQNQDAINNLGVLRYNHLIDDTLHYPNRQEYWSVNLASTTSSTSSPSPAAINSSELTNCPDARRIQAQYDEVETYFGAQIGPDRSGRFSGDADDAGDTTSESTMHPEMLYNMALVKRKRGHLLASVRYCNLYLQCDPNNHTIRSILSEIRKLVSHDN